MFEKIINFNESVNRYINSGQSEVSDRIFLDRINICKNCEHFNRLLTQCRECGCFLYIKARWSTEECPLGRWKRVDDSSVPEIPVAPSGECGCGK